MKVFESPLRDILRLIVWYPLRWLIICLPIRPALFLLQCMGDVHYILGRKKRRLLKKNSTRLPATCPDIDQAVQAYFRNHYIDQLFILIFPKMKGSDMDRLVEIEGLPHLDQAREKGKGVILVHGHFGPAHLPLVVLARLGYPMQQIGNPSDAGLSLIGRRVAYRLRMHYESLMPAQIIPTNSFLRPVFTGLKKNGVVMTTADGSGTDKEIGQQFTAKFLGRSRRLPLGPALLAEKTGAALLPLFVIPGQKKRFHIIISSPLSLHTSPAEVMTTFLQQYEQHVRQYPGYLHFLDRL
jgi:KDO2-lipid IV(A) lauroyltransferase